MQAATKQKVQELQQIVSRIPLDVCCASVVPEFGVRWREVSRAVRSCRLPMAPASVARVLAKHAAKSLPGEEIYEIVSRLRLKLVANQERKWYVIDLLEPIQEETSVSHLIRTLPGRVADALRRSRGGRVVKPEVQTAMMGDLLYMSVQLVREHNLGGALYLATPIGQPVALVSSLSSGLLKGCVEGLGYKSFEDAQLFGRDVFSLLRIHDRHHDESARHLAGAPEYQPVPCVTHQGIDYTYKTYDENYVDEVLGPNPPLLTELHISSLKPFYDPTRLDKKIKLTVQLKSDNVAESLRSWVSIGALSPTSDLFQIFHNVKSNKITFQDEE